MELPKKFVIDTLTWIEYKPSEGLAPENFLHLKKYHLWGKERRSTPYVLVCRSGRERLDVAKRVEVDGVWFWADGDGTSPVTHWAAYERPVKWDEAAHKKEMEELRKAFKK